MGGGMEGTLGKGHAVTLIRKRSKRSMLLTAVGDAPIVFCCSNETYLFVIKAHAHYIVGLKYLSK